MHPYAQYKSNGTLWRAGDSLLGLCAAWNHATNPAALMTEQQHSRSFAYARAIRARMVRLGYRLNANYVELSNGQLWPVSR